MTPFAPMANNPWSVAGPPPAFSAGPAPVRPVRWKPRWAIAVAAFGLLLSAMLIGLGSLLVVQDLSAHDDWLDGLNVLIGSVIAGAGILAALPFGLFTWLGGRGLLITGLAILATITLLAVFIAV